MKAPRKPACPVAALVTALALAAPVLGTACPNSRPTPEEPETFAAARPLMGTRFHVRVRAADRSAAERAIGAAFDEIARVEAVLSEWREDSDISRLNRNAGGGPVEIGPDLLRVVERAVEIGRWTQGAFDITFAACGRLWSIPERRVPTAEAIASCLPHVGYARIVTDRETGAIALPDPGMRLGIAGIGKGYGVDRAAEVLEARGIADYIVEGGGDLRLRRTDGGAWRVGIAHPKRPNALFATFEIARGAVATSGDYMNYFEKDGVRYHHILDPRTGVPARGCASVTVIAPDATTADALATGLFVLGPERGLQLVEQLPGVEALYLTPELAPRASRGFPSWTRVAAP